MSAGVPESDATSERGDAGRGRAGWPAPSEHAGHWDLEPETVFLNHGSFGACPRAIREEAGRWYTRLEAQPLRFYTREVPEALEGVRERIAAFVGADAKGVAFVTNATEAVNAVLRSLPLERGDELLILDHAYGACRNALDFVAERAGATVRVVQMPFPLKDASEVVEAVREAVGSRTRFALLDHITSPSGLVLPMAELVAELEGRGVAVLVDGAHALGMVPLELDALGASWYTANAHKWLCAPRGSAVLVTRADRRDQTRPVAISHGARPPDGMRERYLWEFDWPGTRDPVPWLVLPTCIDWLERLEAGGWPALWGRQRALALQARRMLATIAGVGVPAPDAMVAALAAVTLPPRSGAGGRHAFETEPLQEALRERWGIEVPIFPWPGRSGGRLLRVSAQVYNSEAQIAWLVEALAAELQAERAAA